MQKTLQKSVSLQGIGLHSGKPANLTLHPADTDTGYLFVYTGEGQLSEQDRHVKALWHNVIDTRLCTVIGNEAGVRIATIEHLMAALRGMHLDNVRIEIDGPEMPILDGSSASFVTAIEQAGIVQQSAPTRAILIKQTLQTGDSDKWVALKPSYVPTYQAEIQYENAFIGTQNYEFKLLNGNFKHDLADCRTFCLRRDVEAMQANGLALGGSLDNAVVVDETGIINEEGLNCHNEFVRHKVLDAVGDLALAGGLIIGAYEGVKVGHAMNNKLLHALFSQPDAYEWIDLYMDPEDQDWALYQSSGQVSRQKTAAAH